MKVFKTIVWTSIFWILVVAGIWLAANWEKNVTDVVAEYLPPQVWQKIYNQGQEDGRVKSLEECVCQETECPAVHENEIITTATLEATETPVVVENSLEGHTLFSHSTPETAEAQNTDITALENKVLELEQRYWALVQELQAIFSTPEGMKLLPAPMPVAN